MPMYQTISPSGFITGVWDPDGTVVVADAWAPDGIVSKADPWAGAGSKFQSSFGDAYKKATTPPPGPTPKTPTPDADWESMGLKEEKKARVRAKGRTKLRQEVPLSRGEETAMRAEQAATKVKAALKRATAPEGVLRSKTAKVAYVAVPTAYIASRYGKDVSDRAKKKYAAASDTRRYRPASLHYDDYLGKADDGGGWRYRRAERKHQKRLRVMTTDTRRLNEATDAKQAATAAMNRANGVVPKAPKVSGVDAGFNIATRARALLPHSTSGKVALASAVPATVFASRHGKRDEKIKSRKKTVRIDKALSDTKGFVPLTDFLGDRTKEGKQSGNYRRQEQARFNRAQQDFQYRMGAGRHFTPSPDDGAQQAARAKQRKRAARKAGNEARTAAAKKYAAKIPAAAYDEAAKVGGAAAAAGLLGAAGWAKQRFGRKPAPVPVKTPTPKSVKYGIPAALLAGAAGSGLATNAVNRRKQPSGYEEASKSWSRTGDPVIDAFEDVIKANAFTRLLRSGQQQGAAAQQGAQQAAGAAAGAAGTAGAAGAQQAAQGAQQAAADPSRWDRIRRGARGAARAANQALNEAPNATAKVAETSRNLRQASNDLSGALGAGMYPPKPKAPRMFTTPQLLGMGTTAAAGLMLGAKFAGPQPYNYQRQQ